MRGTPGGWQRSTRSSFCWRFFRSSTRAVNSGLYFGRSRCRWPAPGPARAAAAADAGAAGAQPVTQTEPSAGSLRPQEIDAAAVVPGAVEIRPAVGHARRGSRGAAACSDAACAAQRGRHACAWVDPRPSWLLRAGYLRELDLAAIGKLQVQQVAERAACHCAPDAHAMFTGRPSPSSVCFDSPALRIIATGSDSSL